MARCSRSPFFLTIFFLVVFAACVQKPSGNNVLKGFRVLVLEEPRHADKIREQASADTSYLEHLFSNYQLVNLKSLDSGIHVQLRYADTNNFLRRNFYDGLNNAYTTCEMAIRLCNAQWYLRNYDSTLSLLILDAARPLHVQQMMWDNLDMQPELKRKYLTPPELTSLHNYACAVDITLIDIKHQRELDMGSGFDEFEMLSQPKYETQFADSGELSQEALYNRRLLRHVMNLAGLRSISTEWWHFSLCRKKEAAERFALIH